MKPYAGIPPLPEENQTRSSEKRGAHLEREMATLTVLDLHASAEAKDEALNETLARYYKNPESARRNIERYYHGRRAYAQENVAGAFHDRRKHATERVRDVLDAEPWHFGETTEKVEEDNQAWAENQEKKRGPRGMLTEGYEHGVEPVVYHIGRSFEEAIDRRERLAESLGASGDLFPSLKENEQTAPYMQRGASTGQGENPLGQLPRREEMAAMIARDNEAALSGPEGRGPKEAEETKALESLVSSLIEEGEQKRSELPREAADGKPPSRKDLEERWQRHPGGDIRHGGRRISDEIMERRVGASGDVLRAHDERARLSTVIDRMQGQALEDPERELLAHDLAHLSAGPQATKEAMGREGFESVLERLGGDQRRNEIAVRANEIAVGFLEVRSDAPEEGFPSIKKEVVPNIYLIGNGKTGGPGPAELAGEQMGKSAENVVADAAAEWAQAPSWDQKINRQEKKVQAGSEEVRRRAGRSHIIYQGRRRLAQALSKKRKQEGGIKGPPPKGKETQQRVADSTEKPGRSL